jgi:hypothetical protein
MAAKSSISQLAAAGCKPFQAFSVSASVGLSADNLCSPNMFLSVCSCFIGRQVISSNNSLNHIVMNLHGNEEVLRNK